MVTDSKGHIIIADAGPKKLLVFNQKGKLLYTIGKKGPGPGEFRYMAGMSIDSNDVITVFDRAAQALKRFSSSGQYLNSIILNKPVNSRVEFESWHNNHLLFYLKYNPNADKNYFLHIYSGDYSLIGNWIPIQKLQNLDQSVLALFVGDTGDHFISGNNLYYTPAIYNGYIYKYKLASNKQDIQVSLKHKYAGLVYKNPAQRFHNANLPYADATMTYLGRKFQYLIHNQSRGLFQLNDGRIVHFTYIESADSKKRVFGIELYDADMNPIGYSPIKTVKHDTNNQASFLNWDVVWKDKKDRFYIIDTQHVPKVRVVKLQFGKNAGQL